MIERPTNLGPYRLVRELGRGALGVVHEAEDTRLGRRVAVKVLPPLAPTDPRLERFRREVQAQARVAHPNVVQVFEAGFERGVPFIALELVTGGSLRDLLQRSGRLDAARALQLAAEIARGVQAIHEAGLAHRDLKPENILLDERGTPRVADFGVVRELVLDAKALSQTGQLLGTPDYMSPEQAVGDRARIGPATDVWALGAILHEMRSGAPPFSGRDDLVALLAAIAGEAPRPLEARTPLEKALAAVVERALAKDPARRFASARDFARACSEALERSAPPPRTGRPLAWFVAALLLGVAIGVSWRRGAAPRGTEGLPGAAITSTTLGAPPLLADLAPIATLAPGVAPTSVVVVAGETILAAGERGGPVRAFAPDGRYLGFASAEHVAAPRLLVARGLQAAWATARGVAVARIGVIPETILAERPGSLALGSDGRLWRSSGSRLVLSADDRFLAGFGPTGGFLGRTDGGDASLLRVMEGPLAFLGQNLLVATERGIFVGRFSSRIALERTIAVPGSGRIRALLVLEDGAIALGRGRTLAVVDLEGRVLAEPVELEDPIVSIAALAPARLVVGMARRPARIFSVVQGALRAVTSLAPVPDTIACAAFVDADHVVTGGWDGTVRTFDARSGRETLPPVERDAPVLALGAEPLPAPRPGARASAVSPDGTLVALLGEEGLRILSEQTGLEVARAGGVSLGADVDRPPPLAWSPDGTRLAAGAGPVVVFEVRRRGSSRTR